jgi:tRNA/rRNA methyltransferase
LKAKVILVRPQLGANIGSIARVMLNFNFNELRLVNPREDWLNEQTVAIAAGAEDILYNAVTYNSLAEALEDVDLVLSLTARNRKINKESLESSSLSKYIEKNNQHNIGIIFGPENSGLSNEDLVYTHKIVHIPTNPHFASLNISHAVAIILHEIYKRASEIKTNNKNSPNATIKEIENFFSHLESELDKTDFLRVAEKKDTMLINIKSIFMRIKNLSTKEISTLRGIITALASK